MMTTITWTLNHQIVTSEPGETILQSAKRIGIYIPTLCHQDGLPLYTSCMICIVEDCKTHRFLPACSSPIVQGMEIETDSPLVQNARKAILELLLSEHWGDCYGPCQRACPAHLDIPTMLRQIITEDWQNALLTIQKNIAMPAVIGRICPAPCEKACRRKLHDKSVTICLLKRFVADWDLSKQNPYIPPIAEASLKKIAIVGAGPTGLSAAYYLCQLGHHCSVWDEHNSPGGMLQFISEDRLPKAVLSAEIAKLQSVGIQFILGKKVGQDISWQDLISQYHAVVIATGQKLDDELRSQIVKALQVTADAKSQVTADAKSQVATDTKSQVAPPNFMFEVNPKTLQIGNTKIFAGGGVILNAKLAIRSLADGKKIAQSIHSFLQDQPISIPDEFFCRIAKISPEQLHDQVASLGSSLPALPPANISQGFSASEAVSQAKRCLHCDCRGVQDCQLKKLAQTYHLAPIHYSIATPPLHTASNNDTNQTNSTNQTNDTNQTNSNLATPDKISPIRSHQELILDTNKCIRCGRCIRVARILDEPIGIGFQQRGYKIKIAVPAQYTLAQCLTATSSNYVKACPVGALRLA